MKTFKERVYAIVRNIKPGNTMTYGEVAKAAGSSGSHRAVGNILSRNFDPKVPCHRVIRSDGGLGGYNRGLKKKREILQKEGAI